MIARQGGSDQVGDTMKRCGTCGNCRKLEKVKRSVLRAVNPPFSHADDDVAMVWNDMLASLPCEAPSTTIIVEHVRGDDECS